MTEITLLRGDITQLAVDVIVNAANSSLLGGGGVDSAIHRAAGKELLEACKALNGCKTGQAKITAGYNLRAKFVIHAVGPIWREGKSKEVIQLYNAYYNSLALANDKGLSTIAFPNISTGIYGFPKQLAAETAMLAVKKFMQEHKSTITEIIFVCYDDENYSIYEFLCQDELE